MITHRIDPASRILYSSITGEFTVSEMLNHIAGLAADPLYAPDMPALIDLRGATMLSAHETLQLAEVIRSRPAFARGARRALLVSEDAAYGLMRTFQILAEGTTSYQVFRDEAAARQWIRSS